jgi:phosphatidylglycerophosphatase C
MADAQAGPPKNLALFDFDGTITTRDTFTPFVKAAVSTPRLVLGQLLLSPLVLGYRAGVVTTATLRRFIVLVGFWRRSAAEVQQAGLAYSRAQLPTAVRSKALERIRWHQAQGDDVVVVSASLDVYLADWCAKLGVQLLCSELDESSGVLTGKYRGADCCGPEKARRIRERFDLSRYAAIYAYGDTSEDRAMLELASQRFYRWSGLMG